ncbi:DUF7159 family protein [[Mycobacterium] nativiensis]|uniref:DUF7159 domain-containing protein n=1 Tax=[Mycobacterium] nativiensis TaxID=2855503 RepID=A0ABU5XRL6_9MYCO|nr:hypothetical protein [Mycolicibacter sp. MYC340]MEB3030573.1 hypothetical protein [Mycolicibacter sp. MYC340]
MDTVLGLALTPTTVGWVMDERHVDDCPTAAGDEFGVDRGGPGLDAVSMAASVSAVAARARTMVAARGDRLHGVGVTWSDDAAVAAALLLEWLADAGFENVVPVRFSEAAASLTGGVGRRGDRTAVCVIEPGSATLVLHDGVGDLDPIVTSCPIGGTEEVTGWLADAFASGDHRPDVLMVAGSMRGMDRLGRRLESKLKVPVFVQGGAQQALARGAALALGPHADLTGPPIQGVTTGLDLGPQRRMSLSYAGALTMLTGGAVTFVASLSAALSLELGPSKDVPAVRPPEHVTVARVAVPAAPPPAPRVEAPAVPEAPPVEFGSLWDAPAVAPAPPPAGQPSLLDRVRQHIPRLPGR